MRVEQEVIRHWELVAYPIAIKVVHGFVLISQTSTFRSGFSVIRQHESVLLL